MNKFLKTIGKFSIILLVIFSFLLFNSANWYIETYGNVGFDSVIYTLLSNNDGVEKGLITSYLNSVIPKTFIFSSLTILVIFFRTKNKLILKINKFEIAIYPFNRVFSSILSIILSLLIIISSANKIEFFDYIDSKIHPSNFYDENYIDPKTVNYTVSEDKRNLVYIFMESMETTFFSDEQGGALKKNVIPELYDLAVNNLNFSSTNGVGGANVLSGGSWTIAALLTQTAGVNFNLPFESNSMDKVEVFLPGLYTINDFLHDNGYYQTFMCGSDAKFGGRYNYFVEHQIDKIYDISTARADGIVENNYFDGWWGISDYDLYDYAKIEIPKIAAQNQQFAFFMLTVDTHHVGGNLCPKCPNTYNEQYENVYNCASKQLDEFINWAKKQAFYDNTTFVVVGDHLSMDNEYIGRNVSENYVRQIYNCYINSAVSTEFSKNREFSQVDFFPTTLAALGFEIEGDSLGLGVNLFSGKKTLIEKYTLDYINKEIVKNSKFYNSKFLLFDY